MARLDLTDYDVSMRTGFVLEDPLTRLPPYFDPWNNVALRYTELVSTKTMREEVLKLPVLDVDRLCGMKEERLAHLQLTAMTSGYLWQNGLHDVPKVLPKCLAVPLHGMFEKQGFQPVITYADLYLSNTILKDPNEPAVIENFAAIIDMMGGSEWLWFFAVGIRVEQDFAEAMQAFQDVLDGTDENDAEKIARSLDVISDAVHNMQNTMKRFHENLTVEGFFPKMTTFFGGYGELALHDGLIFEGVKQEPIKAKGANAGQSPVMKALDALLGIEHEEKRQAYTEEIITYMVPNHGRLMRDLRQRPKQLKAVVESSSNADLKQAYNNLVQTILKFRSYHVQIVTKYVIQGAKKNFPPEIQESFRPVQQFIVSYVKGMRDDCKTGTTS
ncbi:myoglobin-like isoform X2 [Haliotis rufescens]|uniref:myoglobin-like isoform X2 n=1 Tax=Haliotis rufescens TaxID=6454 RepID=UPI00201EC729|nr:myoglobin-like isoform X2 [Haliotis rufescens]